MRFRVSALAVASLALVPLLLAATPQNGRAQTTAVVPPTLAASEGNSSFAFVASSALTFQQLIPASALTGIPVGSTIMGLSYRLDRTQGSNNAAISFANYDIRLGQSTVSALAGGQNFASNQASDTVLARSGSLTFAVNAFPPGVVGGASAGFGPVITFSTPYIYTGGNLLLTVSSSAPSSTLVLDAQSNASPPGFDYAQNTSYNATTASSSLQNYAIITQFQFAPAAGAPEPGTLPLVGMGLVTGAGMVGTVKRRKAAKRAL